MARPSLSQRRAEHIVELSGGDRIRRGHADRLEVGNEGLFEQTEGSRTLQVGGTLSESTGGTHTTRARHVERTVRGPTRVKCRTDNIILGGGMSEIHAGSELVLAGMSDDLAIGAGARVTAVLDLWVAGLLAMEEKLASSNFDGAFVDTARTLFEREYGTGVHHAASASFSGAVYATQATGFRKLMKVSSGVRNLSSGGGGGGGDESASATGPSSATPSPGSGSGSGLLGSAQSPRPGAEGFDSTDLARLGGEAQASEDAATYARSENVSDTVANLQEASRGQVAGDSPDEAARAPSRMDTAQGQSAGSSPGGVDAAEPAPVRPESATPTRPEPSRMEPVWNPSTTHERTYTNNQVRIGNSFDEFDFNKVVGERPDKLLSDDAQAAMDTGAFRHMYEARDDVTDMARESVRLADMQRPQHLRLEPDAVSNMTAVEAHDYLTGLQNAAVQANDTEEARRLQDLINGLDHYGFDRYTTAIADAELVHMQTPAKLPSNIDTNALAQRLTALGQEQMALADSRHLSDEERHHAGKLSAMYMLAAQDTMQGLDPLAHIQDMIEFRSGQGGRRNLLGAFLGGLRRDVPGVRRGRPSGRVALALGAGGRDREPASWPTSGGDSRLATGQRHIARGSGAGDARIPRYDSSTARAGSRVPDPEPLTRRAGPRPRGRRRAPAAADASHAQLPAQAPPTARRPGRPLGLPSGEAVRI